MIMKELNITKEAMEQKTKDEVLHELLVLKELEDKNEQSNFAERMWEGDPPEFDLSQIDEVLRLKKSASTYYAQTKYIEALSALEKAIKIVPGDLELLFFEAQCLYQLNNLDQSEIILRQLIQLDEESHIKQLSKFYAIILLKKNKFKEAEEFLQNEIPTSAKNYDNQLLNMLGYAFERQNKLAEAEKIFKRVIKDDPENPNACNSLAFIFARLEIELPEALILVKRALKKEPRNPAYLDTLAYVYVKKGNKTAAVKTYKKALAIEPGNSTIMEHLSSALAI